MTTAEVYSFPTKAEVGAELCRQIVERSARAISERGVFSIALSGGSLPLLLSKLPATYKSMGVPPNFTHWQVLMADERGVPNDHADSNMYALKRHLFNQLGVNISPKHLHGIDQVSLAESIEVAALEYGNQVKAVISATGGMLDLAVLGFGPDGHTCSLFPDHPLLAEKTRYVASIKDSPKPPPRRMTLTLHVLNELTRSIIMCGAGGSKQRILEKVFVPLETSSEEVSTHKIVTGIQTSPPPYPCAMVKPQEDWIWIIDDAAKPATLISPAPEKPSETAA